MQAAVASGLDIAGLSVCVGDFRLHDVMLQVPRGGYAALMGQSGSGKTTLLEAICGLNKPLTGSIKIAGIEVMRTAPALRGVGYVPQDLALFPTLTVREHLQFSMRLRRCSKAQQTQRTMELAQWLGLNDLLDRKVDGLSGGEAQRVAIGRALSVPPKLLLLDEPLSAVDDATKRQLHDMLRQIRSTGVTTLHVTHQHSDARALADCVFEMQAGAVRQVT